MLTKMSAEDVKNMNDEMLVLARASLKRIPSYKTDEGAQVLEMVEREIKERNLNTVDVLKDLLPN